MSMKIDIQTERKEDMEKLLKAVAEFWAKCPNKRISVQLNIDALE